MKTYDVIVIGGGAGGLYTAAGAANFGVKTALIEKESLLGGDCLHYGCIPSKALLHAAQMVHEAKEAASLFSFALQGRPDFARANARVKEAVARIQEADRPERFEGLGIDIYNGVGVFQDAHHVRVGDTVLYGKRIIIATGSRPSIPPIPGISDVPYLTNETIFSLQEAPPSLLTIGAGPIGLELSQAMSRFHTKVTVLEQGKVFLPREDVDIANRAFSLLTKEFPIHLGVTIEKIEKQDDMLLVYGTYEDGAPFVIETAALLIAAGRKANVEALQLEAAGVAYDRHIHVNESLQTSQKHIYAVGDVNGQYPFTHGASLEGRTVVSNAVFGLRTKVRYTNFPWATYTSPEIFHLGLTEEEARAQHKDVRVYKLGTDETDRFVAEHDLEGLVKVITTKKGKILGAHAVATNASDWMQELVYAKHYNRPFGSLSQVVHPYPSKGEMMKRIADLYWRDRLFSGRTQKILQSFVRLFR